MESSRKWWALAAVAIGVFMSTVDGSIVNIALKTIQDDFQTSLSGVEWVVLAYLLTIAVALPSMGRLGDMIGKRRVYLVGFVIFTIGSALCGLAWNIETLIGFRILQAIGAAMIQGVGPALLIEAFPPHERGQALGYIGTSVAAGILAGPVIGGLLLGRAGWESIFFVNIPVGIAAVFLVLRAIAPDNRRSAQRFDFGGALLLGVGLLLVLLALTEVPAWGLTDPRTLGLLAGGLAALAAFIWWEQRSPAPMINLQLFRTLPFSLSLLATFLSFAALSFNFLLIPFYLQNVLGFDAQRTGLTLIASPLVLSLVSPLSGRLADKIDGRWPGIIGLVLTVGGLLSYTLLTPQSTQFDVILRLLVIGTGFGLFQSPNNSLVMGSAPQNALGVAGSLLALMRTLGQTAGIALAGAVWSARVAAAAGQNYDPITSAPALAQTSGLHDAMLVAALLTALAIIPTALKFATPPAPEPEPQAAR